jgi:L-seryl-tRNA(Ser) seleniumtransferase
MPLQELQTRAEALVSALAPAPEIQSIRAVQGQTYVGGGSLPDQPLATWLVEISGQNRSAGEICQRLRLGEPPVLARICQNKVVLDLRTVFPELESNLVHALLHALSESAPRMSHEESSSREFLPEAELSSGEEMGSPQ